MQFSITRCRSLQRHFYALYSKRQLSLSVSYWMNSYKSCPLANLALKSLKSEWVHGRSLLLLEKFGCILHFKLLTYAKARYQDLQACHFVCEKSNWSRGPCKETNNNTKNIAGNQYRFQYIFFYKYVLTDSTSFALPEKCHSLLSLGYSWSLFWKQKIDFVILESKNFLNFIPTCKLTKKTFPHLWHNISYLKGN